MGSRRWQAAVVAGALILSGCSGSNPASPGSVNPPLGTTPNTSGDAGAKGPASEKVTVHGSVADARNGEGVAKATLLLQAIPEAESPAATEPASGSASADGSDSAGGSGSASASAKPAAKPAAPAEPPKPIKLGVDDKGQFEVKDLAPGHYQITATAPGYQPMTIVGVRPAQLHFELTPLNPKAGHTMSGQVKTAADKPALGARVVAGFTPGKTLGDAMTVGGDGKFDFKDLRAGKLPIAAYLAEGSDITAWAFQREVPIALGKDKLTPSPTLTLRAITSPVILSGKVTSPTKDLKPRQVHALLVTDSAEIPLLTRNPDKDGHFRFSLPPLEEGQSYHLVATGLDEKGNMAYAHLHKVADSDLKLEMDLPSIPAKPEIKTDELPIGAFWEGSANASVYRLRVESVGEDAQTLWEGWSSGNHLVMPDPAAIPVLKKGTKYRASFSAIKVAEGTPYELTSVPSAPWATAASLAPVEFTAGEPLEGTEEAASEPAAELAKPNDAKQPLKPEPKLPVTPDAKPQTKPDVKPQTKPAPAKPAPVKAPRPKGQVI